MTRRNRYKLPMTPPQMVNHGNFIVSLGQLIPILGAEAEKLGVDVFAGFAAAEALFDESGAVKGVRIGDMGVEKNGEPGPNFALGPEIHAKVTMFCEGCRGSTSKQLIRRFKLDAGKSPQTYGLGFKELWQLPPGPRAARPHPTHRRLAARQPHLRRQLSLSPEQRSSVRRVRRRPRLRGSALQALRGVPAVQESPVGQGAARRAARSSPAAPAPSSRAAINPCRRSRCPARMLVGDAGGTLNTPKIKGIHQAIRSGMTAAAHYVETGTSAGFDQRWRESAGGRELHKVRNIRPGFRARPVARARQRRRSKPSRSANCRGRSPIMPTTRRSKRLDEYVSPDRDWGDRELPPRDRAGVRVLRLHHARGEPAGAPEGRGLESLCDDAAPRSSATPAPISVPPTSTK